MGEENRGSSGSSTAMIVVAILGGLLLVGCCGSVIALGTGFFMARNVARDAAMEIEREDAEFQKSRMEFEKVNEEMREKLDAIHSPDSIPKKRSPESPPAIAPPPADEKKE